MEAHSLVGLVLSGIALFALYLFSEKCLVFIKTNNGHLSEA